MKCIVAVKRVIDPYVSIRVRSDSSGVETTNVKMTMNPFDEIAIEEAVRLKEKSIISDILAVSIGPQSCQEVLRQALARGADRAVLIESQENLQPLAIAKILQKIINQENADLAFLGKQAIDDDSNQTGQMLAARLGWAQGTFASKISIENNKVIVTREIDGGLETLSLRIPAVLTTDLRLNEPRYITLMHVMQAKRKPLDIVPLPQLNLSLCSKLNRVTVDTPAPRPGGVMLPNAAALVDILKNKERVI